MIKCAKCWESTTKVVKVWESRKYEKVWQKLRKYAKKLRKKAETGESEPKVEKVHQK